MLEQFHFNHPLWLLALLPLLLLLRLSFHAVSSSSAWSKIIDPKLLPVLLQGQQTGSGRFTKALIALGWLIAVVALADPVWEKIPRPIFQTNAARVLVLDLSNSMLIDDLKPNRLARAKFKVEDILSMNEEGQTGLVLFAGDAFTASPLTRDTETIRSLLKILSPQLMPVQGSRADLGLKKAHELLQQSGIKNGQILLIADGVSKSNAAINAVNALRKDGHTVSVLAVGTEAGGELRFRNNKNVSVKLEADKLSQIAQQGGGKYHLISTTNADLSQVLIAHNAAADTADKALQEQDINNEEWYSTGPFIVLLLLPLAAVAFRRGWLLNIAFVAISGGVLLQPQPVLAFSLDELWLTLSQNKEQRANTALQKQQYKKAIELTKDPLRRGAAEYKQGNYEQALQDFKKSESADARYNEGNALAKLKKYKEAIEAYEKALSLDPEMTDAKENKKAIEALLKEQQKHPENSSNQDKKENSGDDSSSKDKQSQDKKGQEKGKKGEQGEQSSDKTESGENQEKQDAKAQSGKSGKEGEQKETDNNQFSEANKALDEKQQDEQDKKEDKVSATENKEKDKQAATQENTQDESIAAQEKEQQALDEEAKQRALKRLGKEEAENLTEEEKMAAEQWLRRIPDDPGGLLRRKFRSQYQQHRGNADHSENPW